MKTILKIDENSNLKVEKIFGMEATFDNPENENARWGKIISVVLRKTPTIVLEHIGSGTINELRGIKL